MRILLLLNARFPTEKAYGIQTITMAQGYAALGHDVAIAYPRRTSDEPTPMPGVTLLPFGSTHIMKVGWMFHPLRFFGAFSAVPVLRAFKPDVVIANDQWQAAVLSRRWPIVWEVHDLPDVSNMARKRIVQRVLSRARAVISTNQLKLDALKPLATLPPTLVAPNAVTFDLATYRSIDREDARRRLGLPSDELSVVYCGQLYDWKGVDTLISSATFLSSPIVLHIVGGMGADLERCKKLAASLPASAVRVVLQGQRPPEEIPFWLRVATVVVVPNSGTFAVSVRDTNPLKLVEAFAAGAAIIASDLPSIHEVVDHNQGVRFVAADDPMKLAAAIQDIATHPETMTAMRHSSEQFHVVTARERAERIVTFLESLDARREKM